MRDQLKKYVELLFAGAPNTGDIQQEILQNTLDRYDDLIAQGKTPEAAYRLAISGIGDINEILGDIPSDASKSNGPAQHPGNTKKALSRVLRAIAIALYILCPIPLFVLSEIGLETIGLCGTIAIVGVATALMVLAPNTPGGNAKKEKESAPAENPLRRSISSVITAVGLAVYFILSFATGAWFITWLVFPIMGAVKGLINACMDLKEVS